MSNFSIDTTPTTKIFSYFKKLSYSFENALAEFLDNSVESFRQNKTKEKNLMIIFDSDRKRIIIRDTAAGISDAKFPRALRLQEVDSDVNGLSEFGMGLKTAGFWMGDSIRIITKSIVESGGRETRMSLESLEKNAEIKVVESDAYSKNPFLIQESGTVIIIDDVSKNMTTSGLKKIVPFLSSKYRNDINKGLEIRAILKEKSNSKYVDLVATYLSGEKTWIDQLNYKSPTRLEYKLPEIYEGPNGLEKREFSFKIDWKTETYEISGWVANKKYGQRKSDVGFSVSRRDTEIMANYAPKELFGAGNSFEILRMFGELIFPPHTPVTQAKDKIDWSDGLEEKIIETISKIDEFKYIKKLSHESRKSNSTLNDINNDDIVKQEEKVRKSISSSRTIKKSTVSSVQNDYLYKKHPTDLFIEIETDAGVKRFISRLSEGEDIRDWIKIEEYKRFDYLENSITVVTIDMNHEFFNPFSEDKNFIALLRTFSINFAAAMNESLEFGEDAESFKERLGEFLGRK